MSHNSFDSDDRSWQSSTSLTPDEPATLTAGFREGLFAFDSTTDAPPEGERWSSWDGAQHGPKPRPAWVITDLGAVDQDLGILKSGKEADVHVVRRWVPPKSRENTDDHAVYMAAKRFRGSDHRMFHRDAGYLEGRRVRRSREMRAMSRRTDFGKALISAQWAQAEFNALAELWSIDMPVPYPVQISGMELLMELIGDEDQAALGLAQTRPEPALLVDLFDQLRTAMTRLATRGWAHGDLSPYNVLLHEDRLVLIDWPQIVDIIGNPQGPEFLARDCHNMCAWFMSRGLVVDEGELLGDLMAAAMSRW